MSEEVNGNLQFSLVLFSGKTVYITYSLIDEELDAFTPHLNWKSDADLVNKLLLNDKNIINLIVQSLLGIMFAFNIKYTILSNNLIFYR
jgi:hypothetical protein